MYIVDNPGTTVDQPHSTGDKQSHGIDPINLAIGLAGNFSNAGTTFHRITDRRLGGYHKERGGNSLAGNIAYRVKQPPRIEFLQHDKIAAHLCYGGHARVALYAAGRHVPFLHQGGLHDLGHLQVPVHGLLGLEQLPVAGL